MSDKSTPEKSKEFRESELASEMDVAKVHGAILRECAEPCDNQNPVPLWLMTLAMALAVWSGFYLAKNSGGFRADVFNANQVAWGGGAEGAAAEEGPPDPMVVGKRVFTQFCAVCHQATGQGVPGQFPPLVGSEWVLGEAWHGENHLVRVVLNGLQGPVTVKGEQFNSAMAPWGGMLKDDQVAAVLTYIRNEWGNSAPPISAEFVAKIREESASRTDPWTAQDLEAIPAVKVEAPAETPDSGETTPSAPDATPTAPAPQG